MSTPPSWGSYFLAVLAAVLAVVLAGRRPKHAPVAAFLVVMVALDLFRLFLRLTFHLEAPGPYAGAQRLAFHADELLVLAWPAGLVALALLVFAGLAPRRTWPAALAWVLTWAALVALYPSPLVRGDGLRLVYLGAFLAGLAGVLVMFARWVATKTRPQSEHAVLVLLAAAEVARAVSFSRFIGADAWPAWMPPGNGVLYAAIVCTQGVFLWALR